MNNSMADIPTHVLKRAAAQQQARGRSGMGDYVEPFTDGIQPNFSMPRPPGPADFPVQQAPTQLPNDAVGLLKLVFGKLDRILEELIRQNIASRPVTRCKDITNAGQTLDWHSVGVMDRLTLKNDGPDPVWIAFDVSGPAVVAGTSDLSFPLKADSTINLTHSLFSKIGVKTASGKTATVNAIAWQTVAGNQAAAIS